MSEREHHIQVACVRWFQTQHPRHLLFAIPNGGKRNPVVAAKLKAEGVLPGVPDLFIAAARGGFNGLFVELKAGKNKPTPAQEDVMRGLTSAGYKCAVCRSLDEFMEVVNDYLG